MEQNDTKTPTRDHLVSNEIYNALKPTATTILPGLSALYFALAGIWGLPHAEQIIGTIAAVNVFLGLLLGLSSKSYNNSQAKYDGEIHVSDTPEKKVYSLELTNSLDEIDGKSELRFKVQ